MTRIYVGRSGVQILAEAREHSLLENIKTSSSAHPTSKSSFFSGSKVASEDSLTIHIHLEPNLKISGDIPPLNLSATMVHIGTIYSTFTSYLCTYLSTGHILSGLIKETFLYITYPLHATT
jgi:hypothetical protein